MLSVDFLCREENWYPRSYREFLVLLDTSVYLLDFMGILGLEGSGYLFDTLQWRFASGLLVSNFSF